MSDTTTRVFDLCRWRATGADRRLDVHESLLYRWRELMKATDTAVAEPSSFAAVTITPEPTETEPTAGEPPGPLPPPAILKVILPGGARLRLEGPADPALAAAVIGALADPDAEPGVYHRLWLATGHTDVRKGWASVGLDVPWEWKAIHEQTKAA